MDGIVEALLRLEGAKHTALIKCDANAYDEHVRAQLHLLDSSSSDLLQGAARKSPQSVAALSKLVRHNTALFMNLVSTSPVFAISRNNYTSDGCANPQVSGRIAVEG
jgi:hypothetical protein